MRPKGWRNDPMWLFWQAQKDRDQRDKLKDLEEELRARRPVDPTKEIM